MGGANAKLWLLGAEKSHGRHPPQLTTYPPGAGKEDSGCSRVIETKVLCHKVTHCGQVISF